MIAFPLLEIVQLSVFYNEKQSSLLAVFNLFNSQLFQIL